MCVGHARVRLVVASAALHGAVIGGRGRRLEDALRRLGVQRGRWRHLLRVVRRQCSEDEGRTG